MFTPQAYLRLEGKGPTLLVVVDTAGVIFGAFASHSWQVTKYGKREGCRKMPGVKVRYVRV